MKWKCVCQIKGPAPIQETLFAVKRTWWMTAHACSSEMGAEKLRSIWSRERQPSLSRWHPLQGGGGGGGDQPVSASTLLILLMSLALTRAHVTNGNVPTKFLNWISICCCPFLCSGIPDKQLSLIVWTTNAQAFSLWVGSFGDHFCDLILRRPNVTLLQ